MIPLPEESNLKKSDDVDLYFPVITVLEVSTRQITDYLLVYRPTHVSNKFV